MLTDSDLFAPPCHQSPVVIIVVVVLNLAPQQCGNGPPVFPKWSRQYQKRPKTQERILENGPTRSQMRTDFPRFSAHAFRARRSAPSCCRCCWRCRCCCWWCRCCCCWLLLLLLSFLFAAVVVVVVVVVFVGAYCCGSHVEFSMLVNMFCAVLDTSPSRS